MWDAIVLAGGSARRLDGVDKPALVVGGRTLLDHALDAVAGASVTVVVGPRRPVGRTVTWCREQPEGGGPVAAIAAGLAHTSAPLVVLLAADLPDIAPAVDLLRATLEGDRRAGTAVLVDANGRRNHLAAVWRREALSGALASLDRVEGASMRALGADVAAVPLPDVGGWGRDCDTWDAVEEAVRTAGHRAGTDRTEDRHG